MNKPVEFALIEYPGVIKNVDKALKTLGNLKEIAKVFYLINFKANFSPLTAIVH